MVFRCLDFAYDKTESSKKVNLQFRKGIEGRRLGSQGIHHQVLYVQLSNKEGDIHSIEHF